eukprot:gene3815-13884_t
MAAMKRKQILASLQTARKYCTEIKLLDWQKRQLERCKVVASRPGDQADQARPGPTRPDQARPGPPGPVWDNSQFWPCPALPLPLGPALQAPLREMSSIFGSITSETPKYEVAQKCGTFEVRCRQLTMTHARQLPPAHYDPCTPAAASSLLPMHASCRQLAMTHARQLPPAHYYP